MRDKFGLEQMVMAGDRGMITSARIQALNQLEDGTQRPDTYGWITALRAPAIRKLMADDGPLQLSLFDQQDLAEITSPDFPGERLIACRNPVLAADRARTREELLAATEKLLVPIIARVQAGRLRGAGPIGIEVGKVITKYKTGKHFAITITDTSLAVQRRQDQIDAEAALDGFYVLRTPVPASELDAPAVVAAYKNLKYVERDFRHIKADDHPGRLLTEAGRAGQFGGDPVRSVIRGGGVLPVLAGGRLQPRVVAAELGQYPQRICVLPRLGRGYQARLAGGADIELVVTMAKVALLKDQAVTCVQSRAVDVVFELRPHDRGSGGLGGIAAQTTSRPGNPGFHPRSACRWRGRARESWMAGARPGLRRGRVSPR